MTTKSIIRQARQALALIDDPDVLAAERALRAAERGDLDERTALQEAIRAIECRDDPYLWDLEVRLHREMRRL